MSKINNILKNLNLSEERMKPEEFLPDAEKSVEYFNKEMKKIFGQEPHINAYLNTKFTNDITYEVVFNAEESDMARVSQKSGFNFSCMLDDEFSFMRPKIDFFEIEAINEYNIKKLGLKFKKILGKSPFEATKKLVEWFKINKDVILSFEKY